MTYQFGKKNLMRTFEEDLKLGKESENEILPIMKEYFKDDMKFVKYAFSTYDFKGKINKYELKTRTNMYNTFPTTLIPESKIFYNKNIVFLFKFIDGLYYIKYDKKLFDTFDLQPFKRNERADIVDIEKPYFFIPISNLTKIN